MARAATGSPNRFLTLTVNPRVGKDPEDRALLLANAWRVAVKRLRREHGRDAIEYLAVFEATKNGEPHLHILLRSPYIEQRRLSAIMAELIESPIVDIRRIKGVRAAVNYVAKYITKANVRFGTSKRYWFSGRYEEKTEDDEDRANNPSGRWEICRDSMNGLLRQWLLEGWPARLDKGTEYVAHRGVIWTLGPPRGSP